MKIYKTEDLAKRLTEIEERMAKERRKAHYYGRTEKVSLEGNPGAIGFGCFRDFYEYCLENK